MAFIETERLILRTWMPSDAPQLLERSPDATMESIATWIDDQIREQDREGFSIWPVVRKDDGRLIGRCGLHRLPEGYVEIAWIFEAGAWEEGVAREAAAAVLRYAREVVRLPHVFALIAPDDKASIALGYALGMRFDRVVRAHKRDLLRYVD